LEKWQSETPAPCSSIKQECHTLTPLPVQTAESSRGGHTMLKAKWPKMTLQIPGSKQVGKGHQSCGGHVSGRDGPKMPSKLWTGLTQACSAKG
jgi:hypothetical protein